MLRVSLLGDFCIRDDTAPLKDVHTPRLESLLAYLMLHQDAPVSRAHLAFLFWPDTTEAQARTNLRNLLHYLRRALPNADAYLDATAQTVQWQPDAPLAMDVADFDRELAYADEATQIGDWAAARDALERAVTLYRGDLLPSCYDDWIIPQREELRRAYLDALERLARVLEERGDYQAAIHNVQRLLRHDPLQEAGYRRLIRLHALNGDRAAALQAYHTCTTILQRELEVEPSAATREAYEQLLGAETRPPPMVPTTTAYSPLVGREREWAQLQRTWRAVTAGAEPHAVMLRGEAGIGKTRLAEDLLQWAMRQGIASANARCYAAEGQLAYAPVTAWLRACRLEPLEDVWLAEVARLLPEVLAQRPDLPRPAPLTDAWQRERLFEALSRAILSRSRPLLLTIDDLQWSDRDTLEWLHFLLRFDRDARLLVVGTFRPEEVVGDHPLQSTLRALRLEGKVTEVDLGPLDEASTRTLASQVSGTELDLATAEFLYRETEGNPLFVVEAVRAGLLVHYQRRGAAPAQRLAHNSLSGDVGLPPRVQAVLEARLGQLSSPTRELARLAATIGREFNLELLATASNCDEDTLVRELDELWQRRIVRERGRKDYDFSHDKLREVAYGDMSAAHRRLLHHHVARALEMLHAAKLDPVSYQLAAHYERAGLPALSIPYYLRAAEVARQVYANDEAVSLFRRGLTLCEQDEPPGGEGERGGEVRAHLQEGLGDVLEVMAHHEEALQAYRAGLAGVSRTERIWQARLHRKAAAVMREQRLYAESLDACGRAEEALGEGPDGDTSAWRAEWLEVQVEQIWARYWLAQWPEMDALIKRAQPVMGECGNAASRTRFLTAACLMQMRRDRYVVSDHTLATARNALSASREWGELKAITECQFEVGFLQLWRRELDEAEDSLLTALQLAESCGVAWIRTIILTYLAVLSRFCGQVDAVREYARRAEEAAVAAHMPDYVAAAQGNLAWAAWREGRLVEAETRSQAALERWHQSALVYPFRWLGLWPLLAATVARGRDEEVWTYVEALLEPTQQRLPEGVHRALESAVQAKAHDQPAAARRHLGQAMELARELGYL
jgi:DNA-binding SARP family transcriptional activator